MKLIVAPHSGHSGCEVDVTSTLQTNPHLAQRDRGINSPLWGPSTRFCPDRPENRRTSIVLPGSSASGVAREGPRRARARFKAEFGRRAWCAGDIPARVSITEIIERSGSVQGLTPPRVARAHYGLRKLVLRKRVAADSAHLALTLRTPHRGRRRPQNAADEAASGTTGQGHSQLLLVSPVFTCSGGLC
jgi:hypothetical protein